MIKVKIEKLTTKECVNARGGKESVTVIRMMDSDGNSVVRVIDCHMTNSIGDSTSLPRNMWMMMVQNYHHELKARRVIN